MNRARRRPGRSSSDARRPQRTRPTLTASGATDAQPPRGAQARASTMRAKPHARRSLRAEAPREGLRGRAGGSKAASAARGAAQGSPGHVRVSRRRRLAPHREPSARDRAPAPRSADPRGSRRGRAGSGPGARDGGGGRVGGPGVRAGGAALGPGGDSGRAAARGRPYPADLRTQRRAALPSSAAARRRDLTSAGRRRSGRRCPGP